MARRKVLPLLPILALTLLAVVACSDTLDGDDGPLDYVYAKGGTWMRP